MKELLKFVKQFLTIIICVINYIVLISILLILSINESLSYRTINNILQNIEVKNLIESIDENNNFLNNIYKEANNAGISDKTVDNFLSSKEIKQILAKYISSGAEYIMHNKINNNITVKNIINETKSRFYSILKDSEEYMTPEKKEQINVLVNNISVELKNSLPEITELTKNTDKQTLKYIRIIFNVKLMFILIAFVIISNILIALLQKSFTKWIPYFSLTILFASIIGLVVALVPLFDFSSILPNLPNYFLLVIQNGMQQISSNFFIFGIIYLIIGISGAGLYVGYNKKHK